MSIVKSGRWLFVASGLAVLAIAASILLAAIPAAAAQSSGSGATGMPRTITVVGTGTAAAAPDLATVQIGIDTQSSAPEEAVRQNDEKMEALIAALKAAGIDDSDIQTSYYSLYAEQRYDPATGQPTGEFTYRVSSGVSVKVRDLD